MNDNIPINLAVEDDLSEAVLRTMLTRSGRQYAVGSCFSHFGFGYLKNKITGFNNAAKGIPFLVLTDLDKKECAPLLVQEWLPIPKHHNLLFRIAVRSVESWLLADRSSLATFLGVQKDLIPSNPDELDDPKRFLIELTVKSRKRYLREAIIPAKGSTAKIGPDYNGTLINYTQRYWKIEKAINNSPSLLNAFNAMKTFKPKYEKTVEFE